jgi:hypothetical protein
MLFFSLMSLKAKMYCSSILDSVSLRIPSSSIRDYSTFTVNRNFKVSPSSRCVSAANADCRSTDVFNKDCISLADVNFFNFFFFFCFYISVLLLLYFILFCILVLACYWLFSCCQAR